MYIGVVIVMSAFRNNAAKALPLRQATTTARWSHVPSKFYEENFMLAAAAKRGEIDHVKKRFTELKYTHPDSLMEFTQNLLSYAFEGNQSDMINYLIDTSILDEQAVGHDGRTMLHFAAAGGRLIIVKYFVGSSCQIDVEAKDKDGWTALHSACSHGQLEIIKYFIDTCTVNKEARENDGRTAFHIACEHGHLEVVEYLIETCHLDPAANDNDGLTPLHLASRHGHLDMVKYLINSCNVDKDAKNNDGLKALHFASMANANSVVKFLIEDGTVQTVVNDIQCQHRYDWYQPATWHYD